LPEQGVSETEAVQIAKIPASSPFYSMFATTRREPGNDVSTGVAGAMILAIEARCRNGQQFSQMHGG